MSDHTRSPCGVSRTWRGRHAIAAAAGATLRPRADRARFHGARERERPNDRALVREMGAPGLIGADLPERHGGFGAPSDTAGLAIETVAHADSKLSHVQLLASLDGRIIARHAASALAAQDLTVGA